MDIKGKIQNNTLLNSFINLVIIDGINYLLPFLALPFLYRTLGAETYGMVASAYSFLTFSNIVIDFGFGLSATREISLNIDNRQALFKIVSSTYMAKLCILCFVLISLIFITENSSFKEFDTVIYLMMGIPIGHCLFPVWYFQGIEKMAYLTTTTTTAKLLSFVPMFIFVKGPNDVNLVSIFYSCGFIFSGIISIAILRRKFDVHFVKVTCKDVISSFISSSPYFLSRVSAALYGVLNTVILGMTCSTLMVGYYDSAQKIITVFTASLAPLTTALYPYMIKRKNIALFKKLLMCLSGLGIVVCISCSIFAAPILNLLFGESQEMTVLLLRILLILTAFVIPSYLCGYPLLAALGHTKFTNGTVIIAGIVYLLLAGLAVATGRFNAIVAASLYVLSEFLVFVLRIYGVIKYKSFKSINYA